MTDSNYKFTPDDIKQMKKWVKALMEKQSLGRLLAYNNNEFLKEFEEEIAWVKAHNQTVKGAVYHDTDHLIKTAGIASYLCSTYMWGRNVRDTIVIAMLLHDFKYAFAERDADNIERTLAAIEEEKFFLTFPQYGRRLVYEFIRFTEWNPENPNPEFDENCLLCAEEMVSPSDAINARTVLRESDQLYALVYFSEGLYHRLANELCNRFKIKRTDFAKRNFHYIANQDFKGHMARTLLNEVKHDALVKQFDIYVEEQENK